MPFFDEDISDVLIQTGLSVDSYSAVSGGDINRAFALTSGKDKYFLKVNEAKKYPKMFLSEAEGLQELARHSVFKIPRVNTVGETGSRQFLVLEWLEGGSRRKDFWEKFGQVLAEMHLKKQNYFGFSEDNYIGSLSQDNSPHSSWAEFYGQCRILPLTRHLFDRGVFSKKDTDLAEELVKNLAQIFPDEYPSLLHGDLWSGNFMIGPDGDACIYDPAVYYGHREMDLGMSLLFGGFDARFYEAYQEVYPLEKKWKSRVELTQLYPLLVHAVLFGGSYPQNAAGVLRKYT